MYLSTRDSLIFSIRFHSRMISVGIAKNRKTEAETGGAFKTVWPPAYALTYLLTYLLMCNSLIRNPRIRQGVSSFVSTGSFSSPRGKLARTRTHARANTHESRLFSPLFLREKKEKRKKGYRGFYDRSVLEKISRIFEKR